MTLESETSGSQLLRAERAEPGLDLGDKEVAKSGSEHVAGGVACRILPHFAAFCRILPRFATVTHRVLF